MQLSQGEKLILMTLAHAQDGKEKIDLAFIRAAILSGNTWALTWELSGVPTQDVDPKIADETAEILSMWSYIEHCVAALSPEDQATLEKDAYPFSLKFEGFDGNNDAHYGVASFLIKEMKRFDEFRSRGLNSHSQASLIGYRRMLPAYKDALAEKGFSSKPLSADKILKIVLSVSQS